MLTKSSDLAMVRWALDEAEKSEAGVDVAVIEAAKARLLQLVAKHEAPSLSMLNDISSKAQFEPSNGIILENEPSFEPSSHLPLSILREPYFQYFQLIL